MKNQFSEALQGKKIPILTLDNKWYRLLDEDAREKVSKTENELNNLLKRQGKLNTETKSIKKLKKKLMNEIVEWADNAANDPAIEKKIEQNKKLLEECNTRLDEFQDEMLDLPPQIDEVNRKLMVMTMEHCYTIMKENKEAIDQTEEWVREIRIELKKRLIRKQEKEFKNYEIYSYMHDVFGAEIINLFDLQYNPEDQQPILPTDKNE